MRRRVFCTQTRRNLSPRHHNHAALADEGRPSRVRVHGVSRHATAGARFLPPASVRSLLARVVFRPPVASPVRRPSPHRVRSPSSSSSSRSTQVNRVAPLALCLALCVYLLLGGGSASSGTSGARGGNGGAFSLATSDGRPFPGHVLVTGGAGFIGSHATMRRVLYTGPHTTASAW
jgi:hypothetical protein|tara:strand:+ start:270 stop:797 length:528 start_codon:yes stop_codon:yes gene_type:complete